MTGATSSPILARNKRAWHEYRVLEQLEAGLELQGTEVRSLRAGGAQITEAYVRIERGEAFLLGAHIRPHLYGNRQNHEPLRARRLLLHRREIDHLLGLAKQPGITLVPLDLHLRRNRVKVELGVCRGKQEHDKRAALAERDAKREMQRALARNWKAAG
ncbi:MAG: SsrA-binding protein SmpB [Candidatus Dormibacteraeota bacterium]|nr:SsrA-binding protein SmpB [Candidatus Dormibacteraeota bacterium]